MQGNKTGRLIITFYHTFTRTIDYNRLDYMTFGNSFCMLCQSDIKLALIMAVRKLAII